MANTIQSSALITGAVGVLLTGVVLLIATVFSAPGPEPLDTRVLVHTTKSAIDSQKWDSFDELAAWIIENRVGGVRAIRCVSVRDSLFEQIVSMPRGFDWSSVEERRSEELGDSMFLELVSEPQVASLGPLIAGLCSSVAVVLLMLVWMRKRLVIPFRELRAMLPQLDSRLDLDSKLNGAHAEVTALACDLRRMSSSLAEKARTSQANFLALELAFEQLHAVLNSLGEGVVVSDPGGELVMANPIAREILQIDRNRGDVSTIREMFPPDEQERMGNAMRRASHNLQTILIEDLVIGNRTYNLSVAPIRDSFQRSDESNAGQRQKDRGVAIVFLDMTEFHELNRMKDDFLSSVSHELRTPLTSIRSFSEILLHMTPDDKETWTEFLEIVNQEAERLTRLVNDVLDLSRIEAGRMEFILEPVEVKPQLSQCVAVFTQMVSAKHAVIELVCEDELPEVEADKDRLHQVMTNLIGNACKFLPENGRVRVTAERAGRYVLFRVEDSGQGVPFDHWDLVFEKFKQVGDTLTEKPQGTGLGLPICRKILTSMKGRIWCDRSSELGGAQFSFTLPISDREPAVW